MLNASVHASATRIRRSYSQIVQPLRDFFRTDFISKIPFQDHYPDLDLVRIARLDLHDAALFADSHAIGQVMKHAAVGIDQHTIESVGRPSSRPATALCAMNLAQDHTLGQVLQVLAGLRVLIENLHVVGEIQGGQGESIRGPHAGGGLFVCPLGFATGEHVGQYLFQPTCANRNAPALDQFPNKN